MSFIHEEPSVDTYRKDAIDAAVDLRYEDYIIRRLVVATSNDEITNIMRYARMDSMEASRPKHPL